MTTNVDVAIVGFGPGGGALASLLGQAGHRVAVLERSAAPYGLPRMSTLDGEIARLLQHTSDPAEALKESVPQLHSFFYGADGELNIRNDWSHEVCGHPSHLSLHQPNIEAAIADRLAECPSVDVRWGVEVTDIEDLGDAVRVTARAATGSDASDQHLTASYVVGMDGAASFVREALGIGLDVLHEFTDRWMLTDFEIVDPTMDIPVGAIHMDPRQPYYWGPNGAGRCRTDVRIMGDDDPAELLDHEHGYAWLEEHVGVPRDRVRITRRITYRFRAQLATSFRRGRVFLGGDAAHAMPPHMGQGSCCAMRDAVNLAWRLDLVLKGRTTPGLLDGYEPERREHSLPFIHGSLMTWSGMTEEDPAKAAGRDAFMRSGSFAAPPVPVMTTGLFHLDRNGDVKAPAGSLSPQGRVRFGGREDLLDNLVGFGFQLISSLPLDDALTEAQRSRLADIGAKVLVLGDADGQLHDVGGTYARFLAEYGATALLSRPDFYLFGVAEGAQATAALVEELLGRLSPLAAAVTA